LYARPAPGKSAVYEQSLGAALKPEGKPRPVTPYLWIRDIALTPAADGLVYTDDGWYEGSTGLWRLRLSPGASPQLIHTTFGHYANLAMSRDGRRLAFSLSLNDRENTWKLALEHPELPPVPLLASTHSDLNPQYSPDGRHIAFHSTRSGASDIWIAASDGSNPWRLTYTDARTTATPRWSPDGEWIAFESNQPGQTEVYVVRSIGGTIHKLTDNPAIDAIPEWSRDGRSIYFCSDRTGRFEVWKMAAAGGDPVQVTHNGGFSAVESPDGKYLYYSVTRNFGPVMRVPLAGGEPEQIISDLRGLFYAVSPRGIYFKSPRAISFWDASTGRTSEIMQPPKSTGVGLAVSPDGKTLLFTQIESEGRDIYMIDGLR
jgi:Tol biopolymer transport system component